MSTIWTDKSKYKKSEYESEAALEAAVLKVQAELFGTGRFYLDIKKKIGVKGGIQNIPDGYLLDLSSSKPRLYVVENELKAHDPLRHIAVQILQFSLSFESEPIAVKKILLQALHVNTDARKACEEYAKSHSFRNVDHLLEHLVFESPFSALVIIDEMPENLENVLAQKFRFGVEVLELARYESADGERVYRFEPFLADVLQDVPKASPKQEPGAAVDASELDTVVVPSREDGFQEVFIGEDRWYAVRIHGTMRPQIKYIAVYQVAPVSAITHIAPVQSIEAWKDTDKVVLNFSAPAQAICPIPLVKGGKVKALQNLRYTTKTRLELAKTLDDLWGDANGATQAATS